MHVLSGLRTGFLVDYFPSMSARLLSDAASAVISSLATTTSTISSQNNYAVCSFEDAHFFVNISYILKNRNTIDSRCHTYPLFIEFPSQHDDSALLTPTWASEETHTSLLHKLHGIIQDINSNMVTSPTYNNSTITKIPMFDLASKLDSSTSTSIGICLPALSGYLLDYPVIYVVKNMEHSQAASRCLSSCTLSLYTVDIIIIIGGAEKQPLLAFSLPKQLAEDVCWKQAYDSWKTKYSRAVVDDSNNTDERRSGFRLEIQCESCCRPVSL